MAIWIQSLSWALIYALGQGLLIYASLRLVLKLLPTTWANARYHLSLSALTLMLAWFATTWWQQFHSLTLVSEQLQLGMGNGGVSIQQQMQAINTVEGYDNYRLLLSSIKVVFPWLSAFYLIGLGLMLVRLSAGFLQLFSLRNNGVSQPEARFEELLLSLKKKINFDGQVQLFISAKAHVPMVIGFLKPIILMPAAAMAQLSAEQLESILLHELAHIKRYDYLVNILQTVVETILFFNPFVWMVSAIIRREREHCCDDLVLDHTREPLSYATALAALATPKGSLSTFTVAASGQSEHLFNRIQRIMEMKRNRFSYSRMIAAILIVVAITTSVAWMKPSFTHTKKDKVASVMPAVPPKQVLADPEMQEKQLLMKRLTDARLIDEVQGFLLEKRGGALYIDGKQQPAEIAIMYLQDIKQEVIRIEVSSFTERLRKHPNASLLQVMAPMTFQSGCADYGPSKGKPGC